jgi:long-subunit fatty acid transport protein
MPSDRSSPPCPHRRAGRLAAALVLAALLGAPGAGAQTLAGNRFNFNFSNPGARSLGFGGAFAALADDATAAFANPAGLVQLTRPEVSVEWRLWDRAPVFLAGGRIDGEATGIGLDVHDGFLVGRDGSEAFGPSLASVVVPRGRWCFAVYGHRLARFELSSESQGFFFDDDGFTGRSPALRERVDLDVVSAGLAAAWRMNDRLRFGLGVVYSDVSLGIATAAFFPDLTTSDGVFEEIPLTPDRLGSVEEAAIDGRDWTVQAGALWSVSDRVTAGLVYRQGAESEGPVRATALFGDETVIFPGTATFAVPDVVGLGLAYRSANGVVTVAGELDRVGYDGLLRTRLEGVDIAEREYQDAWEYHLGAEYALLRLRPILAFRLGGWVEANGDDIVEDRFTHLAAGLGIAADSFQIDLGADFSDEVDTLSLSVIYSF